MAGSIDTRMKNVTRLICAGMLALQLSSRAAPAVNSGFIPGDAMFQSALSANLADSFDPKSGKITLPFVTPFQSATLGGYVGFQRCEIESMSPEQIERLKSLYKELRQSTWHRRHVVEDVQKDGTIKLLEQNPFYLLVCTSELDIRKHHLGLRYNEDWMQTIQLLQVFGNGTTPHPGRYQSLLRGEEFIIADWQEAIRVPGLKHQFEEGAAWDFVGPPQPVPVRFQAADVALFIVDSDELLEFANRQEGAECYRLDGQSLQKYKYVSDDSNDIKLKIEDFRVDSPQ